MWLPDLCVCRNRVRIWLFVANEGACEAVNLFHPSIPQPIQFLPVLHPSSQRCQVPPPLFQHVRGVGAVEGCQTLPMILFPTCHEPKFIRRLHSFGFSSFTWDVLFFSSPVQQSLCGSVGGSMATPPSTHTHPGNHSTTWSPCWNGSYAEQSEGVGRALAMLISLARLWLNPVGICCRCRERRRSLCIIKGFAQRKTGNWWRERDKGKA